MHFTKAFIAALITIRLCLCKYDQSVNTRVNTRSVFPANKHTVCCIIVVLSPELLLLTETKTCFKSLLEIKRNEIKEDIITELILFHLFAEATFHFFYYINAKSVLK